MVTTTTTIPVFVNERRTWVVTNIKHYVRRQDIIDYMEQEYPTVYDARRKKNIQNYNVDVNFFFLILFFCFVFLFSFFLLFIRVSFELAIINQITLC